MAGFLTTHDLTQHLRALGVVEGDIVMAHVSMRRVGRLLDGADGLIHALRTAVGPSGTVMAYTDWQADYEALLDEDGRVPDPWRAHVPAFDPARSRAARDNGIFPEYLRTTPGAKRSGNPGASVVAIGPHSEDLVANHAQDYGYGPRSPLARLVEFDGKVAMLGAPLDTMTLLHHAEHLANIPGKRIVRKEVPLALSGGVEWRTTEEFDTAQPIVEGLAEDYFGTIVEAFLSQGNGCRGMVGLAPSVLVEAKPMLAFAVAWIESHCSGAQPA
jgi:aminoglycoside 3-N-acetyltransferase